MDLNYINIVLLRDGVSFDKFKDISSFFVDSYDIWSDYIVKCKYLPYIHTKYVGITLCFECGVKNIRYWYVDNDDFKFEDGFIDGGSKLVIVYGDGWKDRLGFYLEGNKIGLL